MRGVLLVLALSLGTVACHPNISNLPPASLQEYSADQVVKAVNDVTTAAITANHQGALSNPAEQAVLTINKEVLDTIAANPQGYKAASLAMVLNAKQALPVTVQAAVNSYLDQVIGYLQGAK